MHVFLCAAPVEQTTAKTNKNQVYKATKVIRASNRDADPCGTGGGSALLTTELTALQASENTQLREEEDWGWVVVVVIIMIGREAKLSLPPKTATAQTRQ